MKTKDARSLPAVAQEDLRRKVVAAVQGGMAKSDAAGLFGVSRMAVHNWTKTWTREGARGLKAKCRGRPRRPRLKPHQAAGVVRMITKGCPDQLRLPYALWTREAVRELLAERFGVRVSVWTVGRYLAGWGLTPQKPLRRAYEQDPAAVKRWLHEEHPAIRAQAHREAAEIHWGDEMGLRSDHQAGRSYGRRGRTPVISGTGKRFRCSLLSTITNRGKLAFMVFSGRFTARVLIRFLRRLVRHAGRRVFLIVDRHPVHKSHEARRWLEAHAERIRIFFLPSYSPDLNPDELLNQDVKTNALGRRRPRDIVEMTVGVRAYLRSTQRRPDIVKSYFQKESVRYAA